VHNLNIFGAQTKQAYTNTQNSPWPELGESYNLPPYIILYDLSWGYTQMTFFPILSSRES